MLSLRRLFFLLIATFSCVWLFGMTSSAVAATCRYTCMQQGLPLERQGFIDPAPVSCTSDADCASVNQCNAFCRAMLCPNATSCPPDRPDLIPQCGVSGGRCMDGNQPVGQPSNPATQKICRFACAAENEGPSPQLPCTTAAEGMSNEEALSRCGAIGSQPTVLYNSPFLCTSVQDCTVARCEDYCRGLSTPGNTKHCVQTANVACEVAQPTPSQANAAPQRAPQSAAAPTSLSNPLNTTDIRLIFGRVARAFIGIVGAFALLMYVIGGVMWMTAADSDRVKMAKSLLINSTVGLLLIFFAYFIAVAFLALFGITV